MRDRGIDQSKKFLFSCSFIKHDLSRHIYYLYQIIHFFLCFCFLNFYLNISVIFLHAFVLLLIFIIVTYFLLLTDHLENFFVNVFWVAYWLLNWEYIQLLIFVFILLFSVLDFHRETSFILYIFNVFL